MTSDLDPNPTTDENTRGASTASLIGRIAAGLVAGFIGFYAGLFAVLSIWGLDVPSDASATVMVATACLFGFFSTSLVAYRDFARAALFALAGFALGAIAGFINEITVDNFEVAIAAAAILIVGSALVPRTSDDR